MRGVMRAAARPREGAGWLTRPVAVWALYDAASSAYMALVPTFFGLYFVKVIAAGHAQATSWWGVLAALTLVAAGLLAPLVGASADQVNRRIGVLAATTVVCCVATVAIPLARQGNLWLAAGLFAVAQVAYTLATAIYDSLIVVVARPRHMSRVSGFGWAVGLAGGIVGLCLAILVVHGVPPGTQPTLLGTVFMLSGLLMAAVALPAIGMMHRLFGVQGHRLPSRTVRSSFSAVVQTLRSWRQHRPAFRMLAGSYLINDALVTVVFFVAIVFQKRFGLDLEGLFWLSLLFHAVATPSTLVFGQLADRWEIRRTIYLQIAILCTALALLAFAEGRHMPAAIIILLGLVFGSLQAACRSLFASLTPIDRAAEFFGFNALAGRLSAALGPLTFSAVVAATGSVQAAVLSLIAFLALGGLILSGVRTPAIGSPQA